MRSSISFALLAVAAVVGLAVPAGAYDASRPLDGLSKTAKLDFAIGQALFDRSWVTAPSSTRAADGLGPLYNARGCAGCHPDAGRGRTPDPIDGGGQGFALRIAFHPIYGRQIQTFGVAGHAGEGRVVVAYTDETVAYPDGTRVGIRRPAPSVVDPAYGPFESTHPTSLRIAPPVRGMGLLERIPESDILALADPDDRNGDGISGRPARLPDGSLGRFGWKAGHGTLTDQDAEAFSLDVGMSSPRYPDPWGDCTERQAACRTAPHGDSPEFEGLEIPAAVLALVDGYVRYLPPPGGGAPDSDGLALFASTGCAGCHHPSFQTGADVGNPALAGRTLFTFSDLLLHDLGPDLADRVDGPGVAGAEWRTAPLWGMSTANRGGSRPDLLHDGRARTVEEAILWHGGEAAGARRAFMELAPADRARLLRFVGSL